jgi:DNA helicase HerA-like ATPase
VLSGANVVGARNDAYSSTYSDVTKNKFRYTYIEEHTYTAEDIIFTEFPVEKIKTETFKAIRTSNATYLDFELEGEYDIENHIQREGKITIKKTNKIFRTYVGFDASANAKRLAELIVQNSTAAQKAKYEKIKGGFEQSIAAMKFEEEAAERAAKASSGAAKENLASITVRSRKDYEFTIEEIPAAGSGCRYKTYTFRTNGTYKFLTFCVGSTVKIKDGQTLFVVKKSDNGTEFNVK